MSLENQLDSVLDEGIFSIFGNRDAGPLVPPNCWQYCDQRIMSTLAHPLSNEDLAGALKQLYACLNEEEKRRLLERLKADSKGALKQLQQEAIQAIAKGGRGPRRRLTA